MATKTEQKAEQDTDDELETGSLSGNLTATPELRYTAKGRPVANLRVAVSDRIFDAKQNAWINTETEYYTVICWGTLAENICETMIKGDRVCAVGHWQESTWIDDQGEKHTEDQLTARDCGPSVLWRSARINRPQRAPTVKKPSKRHDR